MLMLSGVNNYIRGRVNGKRGPGEIFAQNEGGMAVKHCVA